MIQEFFFKIVLATSDTHRCIRGQYTCIIHSNGKTEHNTYILHFTFLFSLFVFVSAAGHYFRIWTGHYFSIWTDQVPALLF